MELLIKIYQNQATRIGIKYVYDYQAVKPYEDLVRKFRGHTFSAVIEPKLQNLNLILISEQNGIKTVYKDLIYRPDQLRKLEAAIKPGTLFEFVHIYSEVNQLFVAKPFKKKEFFKISHCTIIGG